MLNRLKNLTENLRTILRPALASAAAAVLLSSCATESAWNDSDIALETSGPAKLKQLVEMLSLIHI